MLSRWPENTNDEHILLKSEALLTVCEPTDTLREAFMKKIKLTEADLKEKPVPIILNEDENVPELLADDYEPQYVEES